METDKIYNENCLNTMGRMTDNFIDLTVTSPPYDNLRAYNGYTFDFESIAKELYRVTKEGGVVVWVVADATIKGSETGTSFKQALYFKDIGFNLYDTMIWTRAKPPQNAKRYEPSFEYMFVLTKGKINTFNPILKKNGQGTSPKYGQRNSKTGEFKKRHSKPKEYSPLQNVWQIGESVKGQIQVQHPATFPEKLASRHIISWSNEGDIIYDPFSGSGTVGKMATKLNRKYIGSEISSEYCEIAEKRIAQFKAQTTLF